MKRTWLGEVVKSFSVNFNPTDTLNNNVLNICKYSMKTKWYKIMFGLIKKIFIGLLTGLVDGSNHPKWFLLRNQKCLIQTTLINLHP